MIGITVNGVPRRLDQPLAISVLLEAMSLAGRKVAVERNGEIVPRSAHSDTVVEDGDQLEIVVAVGGG
jgi:sulfur carrier protein